MADASVSWGDRHDAAAGRERMGLLSRVGKSYDSCFDSVHEGERKCASCAVCRSAGGGEFFFSLPLGKGGIWWWWI